LRAAGGFLFPGLDFVDYFTHSGVVWVQLKTSRCHHQRVVKPRLGEGKEQIDIPKNRFRVVGAERESLSKGEIGFPGHALLNSGVVVVWVSDAPGVNAADGGPQFRKGLLSLVIANEFAVAFEPAEIAAKVHFLDPITDILDGRVIG